MSEDLEAARTLRTQGSLPQAVETATQVLGDTTDPDERAETLGFLVVGTLERGGPHESLAWADQLEAETGGEMAAIGRVHAHMALGEHREALAACDRFVGARVVAADGVREAAAGELEVLRSRALVSLGRHEEAVASCATALEAWPRSTDGWALAATLCADPHTDVDWLAPFTAGGLSREALAGIVAGPAAGAARIAELLWERGVRDAAAVLALCGPELSLEVAFDWSRQLRDHGLSEDCPLLGVSANARRDPLERLRAAATAHAAFGDERALPVAETAAAALADDDLAQACQEVGALSSDLLEPVLVVAATTPRRCELLAGAVVDLGRADVGVALYAEGLRLRGTAGDVPDTGTALTGTQSRALSGEARRLGREEVLVALG